MVKKKKSIKKKKKKKKKKNLGIYLNVKNKFIYIYIF